MDTERFKVGWILVAFDLPVLSKKQRKAATGFRHWLLDDGFQMLQFSVYARSCVTAARQETHLTRIRKELPPEGNVRTWFITRSQWDRGCIFHGAGESAMDELPTEPLPDQLQFW